MENIKLREPEKKVKKELEESEGESKKKLIIVPGEIIVSGPDYLPGDGTMREGKDIIAIRYGLVEENDRLIRVIPISGIYTPRRGNVVIGKVIDITFNGWVFDINCPYVAFLPLSGCRGFISKKDDLTNFYNFGDRITAKVVSVKPRGVDLTMKEKGLHKLIGGMVIKINSSKVPRVIGKKGSMINIIKTETGCSITVGQNGIVWIRGEEIKKELLAKEVIELITNKSFTNGLTQEVKEFLEKRRKEK